MQLGTTMPVIRMLANQVAAAIKDVVRSYPSMQYLVLVGDDLMLPFHRVPDDAYIANESAYTVRSP